VKFKPTPATLAADGAVDDVLGGEVRLGWRFADSPVFALALGVVLS
jgi:hypothetical protein